MRPDSVVFVEPSVDHRPRPESSSRTANEPAQAVRKIELKLSWLRSVTDCLDRSNAYPTYFAESALPKPVDALATHVVFRVPVGLCPASVEYSLGGIAWLLGYVQVNGMSASVKKCKEINESCAFGSRSKIVDIVART